MKNQKIVAEDEALRQNVIPPPESLMKIKKTVLHALGVRPHWIREEFSPVCSLFRKEAFFES
jgi:hypothetical protein